MQIFFFSEFSIGSFFNITHPRLHFNIYAWLHLKHLCVDIYVWFTSHLCVVLHFLIFLRVRDISMSKIVSIDLFAIAQSGNVSIASISHQIENSNFPGNVIHMYCCKYLQ